MRAACEPRPRGLLPSLSRSIDAREQRTIANLRPRKWELSSPLSARSWISRWDRDLSLMSRFWRTWHSASRKTRHNCSVGDSVDENQVEDNETVILGKIYLILKWIIGHVSVPFKFKVGGSTIRWRRYLKIHLKWTIGDVAVPSKFKIDSYTIVMKILINLILVIS